MTDEDYINQALETAHQYYIDGMNALAEAIAAEKRAQEAYNKANRCYILTWCVVTIGAVSTVLITIVIGFAH